MIPDEWRDWQAGAAGDDEGPLLVSVGVVGAFPMARRRELFEELQPLVTDFDHHPWRWAAEEAEAQSQRGAGHRWNARQDMSFVPLRPERVVEVRYDYMEGFRFRHTAQFVRWRPDRDPAVLRLRPAGAAGPLRPRRRPRRPGGLTAGGRRAVERVFDVDVPPEEAWRRLAEVERWPEWAPTSPR